MKLNKKVTIFGKQISVIAIALLAMAGLASAGLLSYYGMITGTATVKQSLVISSNGADWKECTGDVTASCTLPYSITATAGNTQDFTDGGYKFYLKNNANDYVNFKWEYSIPENLLDGLTSLKVHWTTYPTSGPEPACDKVTEIPLDKSSWHCDAGTCTLEAQDRLGYINNIQKFCGTTIGLKPATIPGIYLITIGIVPV